jgi:excisionase family DNA binding protein
MSSTIRQIDQRSSAVEERRELLTIEEAAEVMGMSTRYVRRLVAERRIAFHKLGRSVRIARADIDAYVEAGRVEAITASDVWRDLRRVG